MNSRAIELHDSALGLMPEGAQHDSSLCPICVAKGAQDSASENPSASSRSDDAQVPANNPTSTEGGTDKQMDSIAKETHEALLDKAVRDATEQTAQELAAAQGKVTELEAEVARLTEENASLTEDNERISGDLDKAQVELKTATDRVTELEGEVAKRDEQAAKAEIASTRAAQVKNLGLFPEDYIADKAMRWADVDEAEWDERIEEWKAAKGAAGAAPATSGESVDTSALTGQATAPAKTAKRGQHARTVLGLTD